MLLIYINFYEEMTMLNDNKLAVLGGDQRIGHLASFLAEKGFETAVWGLGDLNIGSAVRCRELTCALADASAVILPLPATADGVNVNCPYGSEEEKLKLLRLLDMTSAPIFGGRLEENFLNAASVKNRRIVDYYASEELQIRNALPTAEGAIMIAMQNLSGTINGCRAAVVGYGRIGAVLAHLLQCMGASVTVAARNTRQLAQASAFGHATLRFTEASRLRLLNELSAEAPFDVIFNTVPARLLDAALLSELSQRTLIIDLSSVPGGVDFGFANEMGLRAVWALALPGKYAPETAGRMIGETLLELFEGEGIMK